MEMGSLRQNHLHYELLVKVEVYPRIAVEEWKERETRRVANNVSFSCFIRIDFISSIYSFPEVE